MRCHWLSRELSIALALVLGLPASTAMGGSCINDSRIAAISGTQSVRLRELRCRLDSDPDAMLSIETQDLDEKSAGVLLAEGQASALVRIFGKVRVVETPALREYRRLLKAYGIPLSVKSEDTEGGFSLWVGGSKQPQEKISAIDNRKKTRSETIKTVTLPQLGDMPWLDELQHILQQSTWPEALEHTYPDYTLGQERFLNRHRVWRYVTRQDLEQHAAQWKRYSAQFKSADRQRPKSKAVTLYLDLTRSGWPVNFLYASTPVSDDGCLAADFSASGYWFRVEIATIRNLSRKPVSLARLLGTEMGEQTLRQYDVNRPAAGAAANVLGTEGLELGVGEAILVPLRIRLTPHYGGREDDGTSDEEERKVAREYAAERKRNVEAHYNKIQSDPPRTVYKLLIFTELRNKQRRVAEDTYEITKVRESFKPHTEPVQLDYEYGPAWRLAALEVGGERLDLTRASTDFVNLSVGNETGSCPILYAWSEQDRRFERYGKIIHKAQGRTLRQSQAIPFEGWVSHFKIAEEELEVSHLESVSVEIVLADGSRRTLSSENGHVQFRPQDGLTLWAGDEVEIGLALPDGLVATDVVETRLTVSGYYERYGALLARNQARMVRSLDPDTATAPPH